ncbi:MAG: stage II sporulation protein R [Bacilli bacterium]
MKKFLCLIIIFACFFSCLNSKAEEILIPNDAIRLRVIANSNTPADQSLKIKVRDLIQVELFNILKNSHSKEQTKSLIKSTIPEFNNIIASALRDANQSFTINYGINYFPEKNYKGLTYDEGNYESLVITLGSGEGDNWWCVLFPPLCLLEAEEDSKTTEIEYKFLVAELIEKFKGSY